MIFFVLTGFVARAYHSEQRTLATEWFAKGTAELQAGEPENAVSDLRNALSYSPGDPQYELLLAQALVAANRLDEAQTYLRGLWDREPGSGPVNLALARLEARLSDVQQAVRFYHDAVYGVWEENSEEQRWQTRVELCQFWLGRGAPNRADGELIALGVNTPPGDVERRVQVGNLFLEAHDPGNARTQFQMALRLDEQQAAALAGAGQAAYQLGDFHQAARYLERAVARTKADARSAELLETARLVLGNDPFAMGLTNEERARRVLRAFDEALESVKACAAQAGENQAVQAPQSELQAAYSKAAKTSSQLSAHTLARQPEKMTQAMDLVFGLERLAAAQCGRPKRADEALLLIEKLHQRTEK